MSRRRLATRACAAALCVLAAFSCHPRHESTSRVIVLGFDGMDYRLTRDLMARGRMPNFAKLAAAGSFSSLATSIPAQSPVAWSSLITGLDAGGHGIYDFIHRDPRTMQPYLSTTRTEAASRTIALGSWRWPLGGARVSLLRQGRSFWEELESHGVRTSILRMPANFPPSGKATRELSGMGTPDLLGTYGTFTLYSSSPPASDHPLSGGRIVPVDLIDDVVHAELTGPENPFRTPARSVSASFVAYVDVQAAGVRIVIGGEERLLTLGEWSDWVPVTFALTPVQSLRGMTRFFLKQVRPAFELYASPINLDPTAPAMPISTPGSFAGELARATGPFYTQGMPEETKGLSDGVLTRDEFLRQARIAGEEVERQYWPALHGFSTGLLFYYFGNLDQVSHMMWRARDPGHPAYVNARDAPYANVIEDLYVAFDRIVGDTIARMGPDTTLIVLSDHGFASWRRSFNLNSWLRDRGYLAMLPDAPASGGDALAAIDWSRTRAYGLGLNGLYINQRGRERSGIVADAERRPLIDEIRRALLDVIDPATGRPVVTSVVISEDQFARPGHPDVAPDLIVGYAEGVRVSNESALGGVPADVIVNNTGEWTGDHCMDPAVVPGILLTSRPLKQRALSLADVTRAIVAEFGISGFPASR